MGINNLPQREELLRRRRKAKRIRIAIIFGVIFFIVGIISYVSHLPKVRISEVVLSGGLLVTEKEIKDESLLFMQGKYFWLFPKNNSFLYNKNELKIHLKEKFKRIDTIDIKLEGLNTIQVSITERKPVAIWCRDIVGTSTTTEVVSGFKESCYFIDSFSTVFAQAPSFSGDAYFKFYGLLKDEDPIGKKYIASSTGFTSINNFIESVESLKIKPISLIGKEEDEFSLLLQGGGEIYFDTRKSLDITFDNLKILLESPELKIKQGQLPVEYVDLRYGNKLFYKLKNQ
jgi:hypothetical protein